MLLFLAPGLAFATDVLLRNDTNTSDTYDERDQVAWLDYPECAIAVFEADAGQLPLSIATVQVYLGTNTGNQDGDSTLMDVSLQLLEDGEDPTPTHMEWGPEAFYVGVSSTTVNELSLVDETSGLEALDYASGRVAVWVCAPDPTTGEAWPRTSDADTSGIIIDTSSPSAGNMLYYGGRVRDLSDFVNGSWIIRAGGANDHTGGDDTGTGGDDTGTGGDDSGDDSGSPDGAPSITSITPDEAKEGEPVDIAILGSGFAEGATVFIGGLAASDVTLNGDTAISARSPSSLFAGTHDVVVNNPDGSSDTLSAAFTVTASGCGCAAPTAVWGPWWVPLGLVVAARRRRVG
jgi:hypothetical protein